MSFNRRDFLKYSSAALAMSQLPAVRGADAAAAQARPAAGRRKVIYDQDAAGPLGTDTQGLLMLLQADNVDVLGVSVVTGDAWLKQELAYTLRLLEMMGREDIPVYAGAEYPMLNRKEEALLRYQLYGGHRLDPWLGAFNRKSGGPNDVRPLAATYGRFANKKAEQKHAAKFIIDTVRQYPNECTIYVGGPLTNLALAVRLAPDIVKLVPEVVFMGTGLHHFTSSYNVFFDPEAARIVLRAPWPKFTVITVDLAEEVKMGDSLRNGRMMVEVIAEKGDSPLKELFEEHYMKPYRAGETKYWFRTPDEMMAAQIIKPSVFKRTEKMYVDINTNPGPGYGDAMFWPANWNDVWRTRGQTPQWHAGPPPVAGLVDVIMEVDRDAFKELFVDLMTRPVRRG